MTQSNTENLSLDPYMRGRMRDAPSYAAPVEIGQVMIGGTVAQIVLSIGLLNGEAFGKRVVKLSN